MNYENYEVIKLTQELVRIESSNIGTFEVEIGNFIYDWLKEHTQASIEKHYFLDDRFNVIAKIEGENSSPNLIYIAHMDTVPLGTGWTKDPLGGEIEDGKLFGRGSLDMKSGLAAAMIAFRDVENECREKNIKPKHDFLLIASGDEEDVMLGADKIVEDGYATKDSWVLDTEPIGDGHAVMAHKGKTWFEIKTIGKSGHGSMPYTGVDAISAMAEIIVEIKRQLAELPTDPVMGPSTVCFGKINGGTNTNIVSDECSLLIDMRLSPPLTTEGSYQVVENAIKIAEERVPGSKGTYDAFASRPFVEDNEDSYLLAKLRESSQKILGKEVNLIFFTGYTDSGVIAGSTGNKECMSYGPVGGPIHQPDEYVICDTIIDTQNVITDLARNVLEV